MSWRALAGGAAFAIPVLAGFAAAPRVGALTSLPAAVAVAGAAGALCLGPRARPALPAIAGAAGLASLAATAGILLTGRAYAPGNAAATGWALAETGALLVLTLLVVRVAPARAAIAGAGLPAIAVPAWLLRFGWGPVTVAAAGGYAAWAVLAVCAVAVGGYLRWLDGNRTRSVIEARRTQRLALARDLHDFVAHDVSGMLAQAQAGEILAHQDPAAAAAAFRRIGAAGRQALASLDRTVHMLHEGEWRDGTPHSDADAGDPAGSRGGGPVAPAPLPTLADLPDLVTRFAESTTARVDLDLDPPAPGAAALPRELASTAYRVVIEALTNVRQHAPAASVVAVRVRRAPVDGGPALVVTVTDDGQAPGRVAGRAPGPGRGDAGTPGSGDHGRSRRGGLGLRGLAERVAALGGSLTAGPALTTTPAGSLAPAGPAGHVGPAAAAEPAVPTGWRVEAILPLSMNGR